MKKTLTFLVFVLATTFAFNVQAQSWDAGADFVSSYVWRGTKFGTGPAVQPWAEFSAGGFAVGAWGSYGFTIDEAAEADLYVSYGFDLGENSSLSFTVTDYYFPMLGTYYDEDLMEEVDYSSYWFDGDSHFIEPMVSLGLGDFSLTAAYMIGSDASDVSDMYLEAGLTVGSVDLALGAGDGAYTMDGDFSVCNISVGTSKEIKITDTFSLPVSGTAILNPSSEQFHIVVAISL